MTRRPKRASLPCLIARTSTPDRQVYLGVGEGDAWPTCRFLGLRDQSRGLAALARDRLEATYLLDPRRNSRVLCLQISTSMPVPAPKYIYKILEQAPPDPLPEQLPLSALDAKDGFIHLSIGKQTPLTASMFFAGHTQLWVLQVEVERLDGRIEWFTEPTHKIEGGCPHLHDSAKGLGRDNVRRLIYVTRQSLQQSWAETEGMREVIEEK